MTLDLLYKYVIDAFTGRFQPLKSTNSRFYANVGKYNGHVKLLHELGFSLNGDGTYAKRVGDDTYTYAACILQLEMYKLID